MATGLQDLLRMELANLVVDGEGDIVDRLVSDYKGGRLSADKLYASVGEIAGMRRLLEKLEQHRRVEKKKIYQEGDSPRDGE
jgi:hypothetical protein